MTDPTNKAEMSSAPPVTLPAPLERPASWSTRFGSQVRRAPAAVVAGWLAAIVVAAGAGAVVAHSQTLGLALAAVVFVAGVVLFDPLLIVVVALPGALIGIRVGGSSTNLSGADGFVLIGAVVALFFVRWRQAPALKQFLSGIVWFQVVLILVVLAHPNRYDVLEWFHRWSYIGGSVVVGWVIATYGRTRQAVRLYLWGASIIALIAVGNAVTHGFAPAQWGSYQKNTIGTMMMGAILVAIINPSWIGLGRKEVQVYRVICILGLLASQSRQSIIILILGLALLLVLNPEVRGRSKLFLLAAIPVAIALYENFISQAKNNPKFNSVQTRVGQISAAFHVFHLSPVLGEGLRFYNLPQFITVGAPPNVLVDNLASTGIVGSLAFVYLVFATLRTLAKIPYRLGTLGLVVLAAHYVDGLFDIFWIGALSVVPFIVAGISLGMADLNRAGAGSGSEARRATGRTWRHGPGTEVPGSGRSDWAKHPPGTPGSARVPEGRRTPTRARASAGR